MNYGMTQNASGPLQKLASAAHTHSSIHFYIKHLSNTASKASEPLKKRKIISVFFTSLRFADKMEIARLVREDTVGCPKIGWKNLVAKFLFHNVWNENDQFESFDHVLESRI